MDVLTLSVILFHNSSDSQVSPPASSDASPQGTDASSLTAKL